MDAFLQSVEQKAYRIALVSVRDRDEAMDIVQDSMFKLASSYGDKHPENWKPLFYRILQNRIRDWQRHQKVRSLVYFWRQDDEDIDIENHTAHRGVDRDGPEANLDRQSQQNKVIAALQQLPGKQQQCFLLRSWEGLSVADTAQIMGCSQGSVKTHFSRAVNKLRDLLGQEYDVKI